jgi:hypothetical protein
MRWKSCHEDDKRALDVYSPSRSSGLSSEADEGCSAGDGQSLIL